MRKIFITLLLGLALVPSELFADQYLSDKLVPMDPPIRMPARCHVGFWLDSETGDFVISPDYDITGLQVTITQNGVVYDDTTVALTAGQTYTSSFGGYAWGEYMLTLRDSDGNVIDQYRITVVED